MINKRLHFTGAFAAAWWQYFVTILQHSDCGIFSGIFASVNSSEFKSTK
jgi:hypothetical protein